ncbi:DUF7096 domain-containing protein [Halobacterium zhouii]|uniref:DUF7096 domain-containing protein n=1 Tax=Halobacterium zhouii TaxID=2902624 RepID=UPI001E625EF2|nr:hypothetical protein [Halobacterium zhouii]
MRAFVVVVTALVVVGASAPLVAASGAGPLPSATDAGPASEALETPGNETENGAENTSTSPGAQLAGVVNVQAAAVEGEVQARSFGLQIAAARSNASRAAVVATQAGELSETLAELRERKRALLEAKQNGSISQARFRAEMAGLAAEISTARQLSNVTANTAAELPRAKLEATGVDVDAITRLRTDAANLSGPTVSSIARSVAGVSNETGDTSIGLGAGKPGFGGIPGPVGGGNWSVGSGGNVSIGPDGNLSVGPDENLSVGPDGNLSVGPDGNLTVGAGGETAGSTNTSLTPDSTTSGVIDVVNDTDDSTLNTSDDDGLTAFGSLAAR